MNVKSNRLSLRVLSVIYLGLSILLFGACLCHSAEDSKTHCLCRANNIVFNVVIPDKVISGEAVMAKFEIVNTNKTRSVGFMESDLLCPVLIIKNQDGENIPYTRYGQSVYDHSTKIIYQGRKYSVEEYLNLVNPDAQIKKTDKAAASDSSAAYRNRTFVIKPKQKLTFTLNIAALYDLSVPEVYAVQIKKEYVDSLVEDCKKLNVKEFPLRVLARETNLEFSVKD